MPRGSKSKYTTKQRRQAHHIEETAKKRGFSAKRAAEIGYATVNKQDKGGKLAGAGRGKTRGAVSGKRGGLRSRTRGGSRMAAK